MILRNWLIILCFNTAGNSLVTVFTMNTNFSFNEKVNKVWSPDFAATVISMRGIKPWEKDGFEHLVQSNRPWYTVFINKLHVSVLYYLFFTWISFSRIMNMIIFLIIWVLYPTNKWVRIPVHDHQHLKIILPNNPHLTFKIRPFRVLAIKSEMRYQLVSKAYPKPL